MSVELYPNIEDLDERLSVLEDPEFAQRIVSANPQLFTSAAAQEEISIFALAWKRFGALALAVTATLAVGAGYAFAPHHAARPALKPVAAPVVVRERSRAPVAPVIRVRPPSHQAVVIRHAAAVAAPAAVPVAAPVRHTVAYHHPAAASHVAAPATRAVAAPAAASDAAPQAEAPLQYQTNTQIVSGNAPPADAAPPSYSKTVPVADHADSATAAILDSCTPPGGRLSYLVKN